jgi:hypothetical protein
MRLPSFLAGLLVGGLLAVLLRPAPAGQGTVPPGASALPVTDPVPEGGAPSGAGVSATEEPGGASEGLGGAERRELEELRAWTQGREQELLTELDQAYSRYEQQVLASIPLTPEQVLEGLQASAPDLVHRVLEPGGDPAAGGGVGELYWSPSRGSGVLTVEGLQVPAGTSLQAFVVDATRPDDAPVPVALFTVGGSERSVVELRPALPLGQVAQVLVTAEAAGGRVVSLQERLLLISLR